MSSPIKFCQSARLFRNAHHADATHSPPPLHLAIVNARHLISYSLPLHRGSSFQPGGAQSPHIAPIQWPSIVISAHAPTARLTTKLSVKNMQTVAAGPARHRLREFFIAPTSCEWTHESRVKHSSLLRVPFHPALLQTKVAKLLRMSLTASPSTYCTSTDINSDRRG